MRMRSKVQEAAIQLEKDGGAYQPGMGEACDSQDQGHAVAMPGGMMKTLIKFKANGKKGYVSDSMAKRFVGLGVAEYVSVPVAHPVPRKPEPVVQEVEQGAEEVESQADAQDELDALGEEELRALAKDRGVKVHHKAGADKIRAALREAE